MRARISRKGLLWALLMPDGIELRDAEMSDGHTVTLTLDMIDVPEGAAEVTATYERVLTFPLPVAITGWQWFRGDGTEITAGAAQT